MKIIGFDIGTNLGWAIGEQRRNKIMDWGTITLTGKNREQRLADATYRVIPQLLSRAMANAVIYEKPFVRGDAATRMLWGLAGCIEAVATNQGLPVVDATATQVRALIFGRGVGLSKDDVIAKLDEYSDLDEHSADAIALTLYAMKTVETS